MHATIGGARYDCWCMSQVQYRTITGSWHIGTIRTFVDVNRGNNKGNVWLLFLAGVSDECGDNSYAVVGLLQPVCMNGGVVSNFSSYHILRK